MATERMTAEEIRDWISESLYNQSRTWFVDTQIPAQWETEASLRVPHSDLNAAREIWAAFAHKIHYVPGLNAWHVWNGVYHEKIDGDLLAMWMCGAFVDVHKQQLTFIKSHYDSQAATLAGQAAADKRGEYMKTVFGEHRAYRDKIHMNSGISGLVSQIKSVFSVEDSFFTDDRRWLVLDNGVIDLEELRINPPMPGDLSGIKLLEHDPARPVWRAVNASLNVYADAPRWRRYLETSLPDGELRKFLAVVTGAAFLAESKTKIIPVLKGQKDCGKTIYIDTIHQLGAGYAGQPDTAAINKTNGPNFEQDQFRGLRFVGISEPDTDRKVDDSFLKKFTGGDVLSTRNLHARSVSWKSQGIVFTATNTQLKFNTSDTAILERFATVQFPHRFWALGQVPKGQEDYVMDKMLESDLLKEFDGILSWVLNGMLVYLHEGIAIPASVEANRAQQYLEGSTVHMWLENSVAAGDESFILEPAGATRRANSAYVAVADAYLAYCGWVSMELGDEPQRQRKFMEEVRGYLEVETVKASSVRIPRLVYKDVLASSSSQPT